jgi:hypothetical protein
MSEVEAAKIAALLSRPDPTNTRKENQDMLKKVGFVTAGVAAGMVMLSGFASAQGVDTPGVGFGYGDDEGNSQVGLLNLNNVDVLHNVNVTAGVCDNNINVLGVQVPVEDVANGIGIPILSSGEHDAEGATPENCASSSHEDGGSVQDN